MLSVFAQLDNELKSAKVKEGMQEAARRGQWVCGAPRWGVCPCDPGRRRPARSGSTWSVRLR